jgi:hypothetical protein
MLFDFFILEWNVFDFYLVICILWGWLRIIILWSRIACGIPSFALQSMPFGPLQGTAQ